MYRADNMNSTALQTTINQMQATIEERDRESR